MNRESLEKACDNLVIDLVRITKTKFFVDEQYEFNDLVKYPSQGFKGLVQVLYEEIKDENSDDCAYVYRFFYTVGYREISEETESNDGDQEDQVKLYLEAEFEARYYSMVLLDQESIEAFCEKNIEYHVWPYWREFAHSMCQRADISKISAPLNQIARNIK